MIIKFVNLCDPSPATKLGEYKLNDIVEIMDEDDLYYRVYLNNEPYYVKVPADLILLSELKDKTWTLDNTNRDSKIVKCGVLDIYLSDILNKYGYSTKLELFENNIDPIPEELYRKKRLEFKEL